jgi:hypothetical protein
MLDKAELEIQAKLEIRIGKALLRAKLIMIGNGLMVAWLASVVLATIWYLAYGHAGASLSAMVAPMMGMSVEEFMKLNGIGIGLWKMAAGILLLCPGIGFRVCGEAMKP